MWQKNELILIKVVLNFFKPNLRVHLLLNRYTTGLSAIHVNDKPNLEVMLINNLEKNNTVRRFKMRKRINVKKSIALLMASVLFVQSAGFTKQVSADDTDTHDYSSISR